MKSRLLATLLLSFAGTFLAVDACFAQEQVTITTYYPAPYGIYRELRADQMAVGSAYRGTPLNDGNLIISGSVAIGSQGITERLRVEGNIITSGGLATGPYSFPFPLGWTGVQTHDVWARYSVRANQLCLGGAQNGTDTGTCQTRWATCTRYTYSSNDVTDVMCPAGTAITIAPFALTNIINQPTAGMFLCCKIDN